MTSWASHNKSKKEKSLENISDSVLSSTQRNADMVPTPQRIYLSSCFGLNWRWWRALHPRPHADATVTLNLSQVIFATSTHRVVTFVFPLALVTAEPTHPPRDAGCDSLCVTLEAYMAKGRGGSSLRQGPSVVHCLIANSASVCVCARSWMNHDLSNTMMTYFPFFPFCLHTPLPLLFHRWPTDRTAEDIRVDDRIAPKTPTKHNAKENPPKNDSTEERERRPPETPQYPCSAVLKDLPLPSFPCDLLPPAFCYKMKWKKKTKKCS